MSSFKKSSSKLESPEEQHTESLPDAAICLQQGDRVCYNDIGNKEIVKKIYTENASTRSQESVELDSIRSGESLFKTFTFDIRQDSNPDMKKCLEFWKTVLEKNVKPVKCSFLKEKSGNKVKKENKPQQPKDVCDSEEMLKKWTDIYKDLQRRKLDKIKLMKKQKRESCEDYFDEEFEKKQEKEDIKNLNNWTPRKESTKSETLKNFEIKRALRNQQSNKEQEEKQGDDVRSRKSSKPISSRGSSKVSILTPPRPQSPTSKRSASLEETTLVENPTESPENSPKIPESPQIHEKPPETSSGFPAAETEDDEVACGVPCDCARPCTCHPRADNAEICTCGCATAACVCREIRKVCMCGCFEEDCICERPGNECFCGCGLDECVCGELFPGSCRCGHEDCQCDLLQIMSGYMETISETTHSPPVRKEERRQSKTVQSVQTIEEERDWRVQDLPRIEGASYCVICGHYNCFCQLEKSGERIN